MACSNCPNDSSNSCNSCRQGSAGLTSFRIASEANHVPEKCRYNNTVVEDPNSGAVYLYDACGNFVALPASGGEGGGDSDPQILSINGYQLSISGGNTVTLPSSGGSGTDSQTLAFNNGTRTLTITGGNSVVIPDSDSQQMAFNTTTRVLSLTGGNQVVIPAGDTPQTLAFNTGTRNLSISGGNTVNIPDVDAQTLSISGNIITISNGNSITIPSSGGGGGGAPTYTYTEDAAPSGGITHTQAVNKHTYKFVGTLSANRTITLATPSDTTQGNVVRFSFIETYFRTSQFTITNGTDVYTVGANTVLEFEYTSAGWKRVV